MRLSEKTIEINFCAQAAKITKRRLIWFGLTQKQEANAGFDVYTKIGGRILIFQFKASNVLVKDGWRRFQADHTQMENLRKLCKNYQRSVFYVFPLLGTTYELSINPDLISQTSLLDVDKLPVLAPPVTKRGDPRKNNKHYVDVIPERAVIHSEPIEAAGDASRAGR